MKKPTAAPSPSPTPSISQAPHPLEPNSEYQVPTYSTSSKLPVDFSPPLIAMVIIIAVAFIFITYSRLISRQFVSIQRQYLRWRRRYAPSSSSAGNMESSPQYPFDHSNEAFYLYSPYGLEETAIRTIPLTIYNRKSCVLDCAVCLLEFEDNDYVRTLPSCSHSFHVDCIDIWLRSHANCPLCRAGIYTPESPFTPLMAARIRPSLEDVIIETTVLETNTAAGGGGGEITQLEPPSPDRRNFLLKRSYSFSFERNIGSERLVLEAATTSPWRYRRNKRTSSPFRPRVVSFFRRRFPVSESFSSASSRRRNFFSSPMFSSRGLHSSSRLRSGDPEALLSPDRYNNRRWR
ncbi:ubiquitin-protein ligase [Lithospermum erythrorhizon]|uniref:RING-type E3 ubiquitin transferase n=1 Tax=Lithospermum erythrorhizon TaxID=34254 RepID=A0AAV3RSG5_LITER